ncbi:thiamine pyrophosphate-dependent dehydrogenase E1 component subunit alpha [Sphingopyxis sp. YF1]|uniref:thiamine pyrophosphate-dependent dehydrogenase E1 component subunit alpha n=1 Tax=Sphingopyxis sp. YF1 TaxID=2482763 RepID=UPI001F605BE6|nr:thiamine pyrophosphate-dependent dehydrogenase E1 component subunit alpha [Sphingopyxis sp. YF1]UNU43722.1 thiamine pyrophosphate-dependent dehydrogenase E1 component subunit alpha [Sphingopyxis sp. YF1]
MPPQTHIADEVLLDIYRRANLVYQCDEKFRNLILSGTLQILYYSPRGQEILAAALMAALQQDDYLVTTYRGMHDQLAKGIPARDLWSEFAGKGNGTCKGKGGPMHITHPETGVMVTTGIVGSGMPIANGLALASQLERDNKVTVVCFGDAATNIGAFHESLNMAQIWKLPVLFVCQNNLYGEHTPQAMSTGCKELVDRGIGYGIRSVQVNGNDAFAMYDAAKTAVDLARAGEGPTFIEAKTFRFFGHLLGDDSHYIPAEEMAAAKAVDPVPAFRSQLLARQIPETTLDKIDAELRAEVDAAAAHALESSYPDIAELRRDVYEEEIAA